MRSSLRAHENPQCLSHITFSSIAVKHTKIGLTGMSTRELRQSSKAAEHQDNTDEDSEETLVAQPLTNWQMIQFARRVKVAPFTSHQRQEAATAS
jgi:hypothetical protein